MSKQPEWNEAYSEKLPYIHQTEIQICKSVTLYMQKLNVVGLVLWFNKISKTLLKFPKNNYIIIKKSLNIYKVSRWHLAGP